MLLLINKTFIITENQTLTLYENGVGFAFINTKIDFDFHYEFLDETLLIVLNDDASWAELKLVDGFLQGTLYSYLSKPVELSWELQTTNFQEKPKAKNALQSVRFHDEKAFLSVKKEPNYSELLIEAATCGHVKMLELCLDKGASLHVEIENFKSKEDEACFALTKAIQCGHVEVVKVLLAHDAKIHPKVFDLHRDNFYHACFLYQSRPAIGETIIHLLLDAGVNFSSMSAYYLTAVMYRFTDGPLAKAQADTKMLELLIDKGVRLDDFMLILATEEDTAFMYAAHMGWLDALKLLVAKGVDVFKSYEGINALDRAIHPVLHDPQMPNQGSYEVEEYLLSLGLKESKEQVPVEIKTEELPNKDKQEDIGSLESLFAPSK